MKNWFVKAIVLIEIYFFIIHQIKQLKMKNWKTSLFGTLAAVCTALTQAFPEYQQILVALASLFGALFAYFAKDSDVSGTAKILAIAIVTTFSIQTFAQTTNVAFTGYPAAGANGSIQTNGFGGLTTSDSVFLKRDTLISIVSSNVPSKYLTDILGSASLNGFNGILIGQADTNNLGDLSAGTYVYSNSGSGNMAMKLNYNGANAKLNMTMTELSYTDSTGKKYNLENQFDVYSKSEGGIVSGSEDFAMFYGYGNGSVSGVDTVYLTNNGLESGTNLFRTINTNEIVVSVNSANDTMLITKVVSVNTGASKKYITVKMKYLTTIAGAIPVWANVPDGIKVKAIVSGKLD